MGRLLAEDGAAFDLFGNWVGISGNTVIVGSPGDDDFGTDSGSAYLFDATTGAQIAKLNAQDGAAFHNFGYAVDISEDVAIVSSPSGDGSSFAIWDPVFVSNRYAALRLLASPEGLLTIATSSEISTA